MAEPLSSRVVWAVADAKGVDPTDLPPLSDAVDPDALDALLPADPDSDPLTIEFDYDGHRVTVRDGTVEAAPLDEANRGEN